MRRFLATNSKISQNGNDSMTSSLPEYSGNIGGLDQAREVFISEKSSTIKIRKKSVHFDVERSSFLENDCKRKKAANFLPCMKNQHNRNIWKIAALICIIVAYSQILSSTWVKKRSISAAIKYDYSSIKGLGDLQMRNDQISIKDRCYVSDLSTFPMI